MKWWFNQILKESKIKIEIFEISDFNFNVENDFSIYFNDNIPSCITYYKKEQDIDGLISMGLIYPDFKSFKDYYHLFLKLKSLQNNKTIRFLGV